MPFYTSSQVPCHTLNFNAYSQMLVWKCLAETQAMLLRSDHTLRLLRQIHHVLYNFMLFFWPFLIFIILFYFFGDRNVQSSPFAIKDQEEKAKRCEYAGTETRKKDRETYSPSTLDWTSLSPPCPWYPKERLQGERTIMSENWTCVMTKRLTWTQHAESSELFFAHVDDLCRIRSALVTKRNDGRHSLLSMSMSMMVESVQKSQTRLAVRKGRKVTRR